MEFTTNVNLVISNARNKAEQLKREKVKHNNTRKNLEKRLAKLSGGRTKRKRNY